MFKKRSTAAKILTVAIVAVIGVVLIPDRPPSWDAVFQKQAEKRALRIAGAKGVAKHVPAIEYYYMSRMYGNPGINPDKLMLDALQEVELRFDKGLDKSSLSSEWQSLGPANIAGRIRAIAIDPGTPATIYVGGASGGVFKSTEGGSSGTWRPVMDFTPAIPVGAIAIDPTNTDILYAGTGEPTMELSKAYGAPSFGGVGIMKSTDAGETWTHLPWPLATSAVHRVRIDPYNSSHILVAAREGLYRSLDAGNSWTRVQTGVITDLVFKIGAPDVVYSAIGNDDGGTGNGVYVSTQGGKRFTWTKVADNFYASDSTGRIILGTTPADPDHMIAMALKSRRVGFQDDDYLGMLKLGPDGQSWERITNNLPGNYTSGQGFYDFCVAVSPTDKNLIITGGFETYRSTNGGSAFTKITSGNSPVHVDQHIIEFTPDGSKIYLGNDGGMFRSTTRGSSWTPLPGGLETIQFYTLAYDFNNPDMFYGGVQDHGIFQTAKRSDNSWYIRRGGDGGYVCVDPEQSNIIYSRLMIEGGRNPVPYRSTNGGQTWTRLDRGFGSVEADRFNWLTPMMLNPQDRTRMFTASQMVYTAKGVNIGSPQWTTISPDLTKRSSGTSIISTLAMCEGNPRWMYIGTGDGNVQVSQDVLALDVDWSLVSGSGSGLPNKWVTRIKVDYDNPEIAYVTYSGYNTDHVYKTTNAGQDWTTISGNLPDVPVNGIALSRQDANTLFVGTDIGVWYTYDGGANWAKFGTDLPNVVVYDIDIDPGDRLIAATHGRGMWLTSSILSTGPAISELTFGLQQNYPNPFSAAAGSTISFNLERASIITLKVYDVSGREVATLLNDRKPAGTHSVIFPPADLQSGVYFYTLSGSGSTLTKKMLVL